MPDMKTLNSSAVPVNYVDMGDGTYAERVVVVNPDGSEISGGSGGTSTDREVVITTYRVKTAFAGASIGDTVTATRVLDVSGSSATQVGTTIWYNEATASALVSAPAASNIELTGANALTEAQLRSAAVLTKDNNGTGAVRYTTDTTAVTGSFSQIMCLTNTTFSLLTRTGATGSLVGVALPAGTLLVGPFTAYTLTSGAVAAYG